MDAPMIYQVSSGVHIGGQTGGQVETPIQFDPWQAYPLSTTDERIDNMEPFKEAPSPPKNDNIGDREVDLIANKNDLGILQCAVAKSLSLQAVNRYEEAIYS